MCKNIVGIGIVVLMLLFAVIGGEQ